MADLVVVSHRSTVSPMTRTGDTLTDMRSAASINDADAEEHR
jgi:hypothetical protein